MAEQQPRPILITGAGRRIGLALAHHFLQQRQPVIVSYRTPYPAIDGLREAGALCLQADFSSDDGILTFAEAVKSHTDGLRAIIHNASDWMAEKPGVPLSAVLARLRLHLRQHIAPAGAGSASSTLTPHKTISFGSLTIDPVNRQVLLGGENVALSTADFDLLWELATHAGQIMDRDALLKNLRGVTYDGMDRSVDVAISRLRKKLLDNATEPYRIKTVRNKGYLFAPHAWDN
ncbi:TPA: SDR family NAD(P)-dependent oxidoreductase [Klebsiella pneumoniae]